MVVVVVVVVVMVVAGVVVIGTRSRMWSALREMGVVVVM
jgi:hypothetical protein